jgi:hypothetical protein
MEGISWNILVSVVVIRFGSFINGLFLRSECTLINLERLQCPKKKRKKNSTLHENERVPPNTTPPNTAYTIMKPNTIIP